MMFRLFMSFFVRESTQFLITFKFLTVQLIKENYSLWIWHINILKQFLWIELQQDKRHQHILKAKDIERDFQFKILSELLIDGYETKALPYVSHFFIQYILGLLSDQTGDMTRGRPVLSRKSLKRLSYIVTFSRMSRRGDIFIGGNDGVLFMQSFKGFNNWSISSNVSFGSLGTIWPTIRKSLYNDFSFLLDK